MIRAVRRHLRWLRHPAVWIGVESVTDLDGQDTYRRMLNLQNPQGKGKAMTRTPNYDTQTNPGFLGIHDGDVACVIDVNEGVHVDLDATGRVLGIERIGGTVDYDTLLLVLKTIRVDGEQGWAVGRP